MKTIDDLPNELLLKIFKKFDIFRELPTLAVCCRRWRDVAFDGSLYHTVTVETIERTQIVTNILKYSGNSIQELCFNTRWDMNLIAPYLKDCINLKKLALNMCNYYDANGEIWKMVLSSIGGFHHLTSLTLNYSVRSLCREMDQLLNILEQLPIRRLSIRENGHVIQFEQLKNLVHLEELTLEDIVIRGSGEFSKSLTSLNLNVQFEDSDSVFRKLKKCEKLKHLRLSKEALIDQTDHGLNELHTLKLESFDITEAKFSSASLADFFSNMKTLTEISLFACNVSGQVVDAISKNCRELQKCFFYWPRYYMLKKDDIIKLVNRCGKIEELGLHFVAADVVDIIHTLPMYLVNLREVHCLFNAFNDHETTIRAKIEQHMPDFVVEVRPTYINCVKNPAV